MEATIYTTDSCTYCKQAKSFFDENNVSYNEFNVGKDLEKRQEMIDKSGQMGVPVITVGDEVIIGFNKQKLQQLLNLD